MLMVSKVESKMLESIPNRWKPAMQRVEEINRELRCTDIRLLHNPTDEQIRYFCSIVLEGNRLCNEIDIADIETSIGSSTILRNYISNFREVCRAQGVAATYVWRAQLKRIAKEKDVQYCGISVFA